jgi:hypothetical protein
LTEEAVMDPRQPRKRKRERKRRDDDKVDQPPNDSVPASDPVAFIEPAPRKDNDTPLDKQRDSGR